MNQADQIELIGHGRQLSADGLACQEQSEVEHGAEDEPDKGCSTTNCQQTVTSALTRCLTSGDHLSFHSEGYSGAFYEGAILYRPVLPRRRDPGATPDTQLAEHVRR